MQPLEISGRDHRHERSPLQRARVAGLLRAALLRLRPLTPQASRLAAHFKARGLDVERVESIALSSDGAMQVLEMALAHDAAPIVFLVCSTHAAALQVFERMRAREKAELVYRNGRVIMYLWRWQPQAPQLEHAVAVFASFRARTRVAVLRRASDDL